MARVDQLKALLKANEAEEHEALRRQKEVDRIVDQRSNLVVELRAERDERAKVLSRTLGSGRLEALQGGDGGLLSSRTAYGKRLKKELEDLERVLQRREEELARAHERAEQAAAEVLECRVERRKVEQLIESRQLQGRARDIARDELAADEVRQFQNRNREK